jgi:carbamoyl-phosphate synthase small subunit
VAYDFGVKRNILRMLASAAAGHRGAGADAGRRGAEMRPTASSCPTAPGDPEPCDYAIAAVSELIDTGIPTFGICLGHQILALASGAKTFKMKFGHHGANHPVKDLDSGRVSDHQPEPRLRGGRKELPANLRATHVSLFDGTLQGLARTDKPAFCFQGHPEASPGPHDIAYLFDRFTALMEPRRRSMPKRTDIKASSSSAPARSSSARPASSTTPACRPARRCAKRATRSS